MVYLAAWSVHASHPPHRWLNQLIAISWHKAKSTGLGNLKTFISVLLLSSFGRPWVYHLFLCASLSSS